MRHTLILYVIEFQLIGMQKPGIVAGLAGGKAAILQAVFIIAFK